MRIEKYLISYLQNLPGIKTNRKIVVIESDDWGSIRMPSRKVYDQLFKKGYKVDLDPYMKYDCMANSNDLEALFEVLSSVQDKNGRNAIITANTIMANPDFEKIKNSEFTSYYFEHFTKTLERYGYNKAFEMWKEGIQNKLFYPQFHGREHLNVFKWIQALSNGEKAVREAFDHGMISISLANPQMHFDYMEALDFYSIEEMFLISNIIEEGLEMFKSTFGFSSRSFIACCFVWDQSVEKVLSEFGVKFLQGVSQQLVPQIEQHKGHYRKKLHYLGQRNHFNQIYMIRNAYFSPSSREVKDDIGYCLKRMGISFSMRKPVIISSHRLNFVGGIEVSNRDNNLKLFKQLLKLIIKKWPDVEFLTSDELGEQIDKRIGFF